MGYRVVVRGAAGERELTADLFNVRPGEAAVDVFRPFDPNNAEQVQQLQGLGDYVAQGGPWVLEIWDGAARIVRVEAIDLTHLVRPVAGQLQEVLLATQVRSLVWGGQP